MKTTTFYSLHGVQLTGEVVREQKINRTIVKFVHKLGRIYATTENYSLAEAPEGTNEEEMKQLILEAL